MKLSIRRAVEQDCPRLMELVNELAHFERAPEQVTVNMQHFKESGFGKNPVWWGFVAQADDEVVGFALYYIRYSTWKGQALYLEDLIVTESMRGLGLGKLLFDRLVEEAIEKKFTRMIWQVLDWNESAIEFYKKYGAQIESGWLNGTLPIPLKTS